MPTLTRSRHNEARRLITLVDQAYERGGAVLCHTDVPLQDLLAGLTNAAHEEEEEDSSERSAGPPPEVELPSHGAQRADPADTLQVRAAETAAVAELRFACRRALSRLHEVRSAHGLRRVRMHLPRASPDGGRPGQGRRRVRARAPRAMRCRVPARRPRAVRPISAPAPRRRCRATELARLVAPRPAPGALGGLYAMSYSPDHTARSGVVVCLRLRMEADCFAVVLGFFGDWSGWDCAAASWGR